MEYVSCNLCSDDRTRLLFKKRDKFSIVDDEFNVVECLDCGLLYVNPRPSQEEISNFYPETYSWRETFEADSFFSRFMRRLEKVYRYHLLRDEVSRVLKVTGMREGSVLDVGCGTGDRLDVFRGKGFDTHGVEISGNADFAREHMRLDVMKCDIFSAGFPDESFDIVTLYNVIEHTHDPLKVCLEIHRILKDGGYLIVQAPNKDCLQYHFFGSRWAAFDVPRDLYYFNIRTMTRLLATAGFRLIRIDHYMNLWHPPTLAISVFPGLDPQKFWLAEGKGQTSFLRRGAWIIATFFSIPFALLESSVGRGALVTYYAAKGC